MLRSVSVLIARLRARSAPRSLALPAMLARTSSSRARSRLLPQDARHAEPAVLGRWRGGQHGLARQARGDLVRAQHVGERDGVRHRRDVGRRVGAELREVPGHPGVQLGEALPALGGPVRVGPVDEVDAEADKVAATPRAGCLALPDPELTDFFQHVYVEETPQLAEQRDQFAAYAASFEGEG